MTDLGVRRFEGSDGPAVRDLHERAMRDAGDYAEDVPDPDLDDVPGHYLDGDGEFLVGILDGDVVATAAFHPATEWVLADRFDLDDGTAELTRMRVDPAVQRGGLGATIYGELEGRAREAGYRAFGLDVGEDNDATRVFYETLGFEYVETITVGTTDQRFRLAVYRRSLHR